MNLFALIYQIPIGLLSLFFLIIGFRRMETIRVQTRLQVYVEAINQFVGAFLVIGSIFALIFLFR